MDIPKLSEDVKCMKILDEKKRKRMKPEDIQNRIYEEKEICEGIIKFYGDLSACLRDSFTSSERPTKLIYLMSGFYDTESIEKIDVFVSGLRNYLYDVQKKEMEKLDEILAYNKVNEKKIFKKGKKPEFIYDSQKDSYFPNDFFYDLNIWLNRNFYGKVEQILKHTMGNFNAGGFGSKNKSMFGSLEKFLNKNSKNLKEIEIMFKELEGESGDSARSKKLSDLLQDTNKINNEMLKIQASISKIEFAEKSGNEVDEGEKEKLEKDLENIKNEYTKAREEYKKVEKAKNKVNAIHLLTHANEEFNKDFNEDEIKVTHNKIKDVFDSLY